MTYQAAPHVLSALKNYDRQLGLEWNPRVERFFLYRTKKVWENLGRDDGVTFRVLRNHKIWLWPLQDEAGDFKAPGMWLLDVLKAQDLWNTGMNEHQMKAAFNRSMEERAQKEDDEAEQFMDDMIHDSLTSCDKMYSTPGAVVKDVHK